MQRAIVFNHVNESLIEKKGIIYQKERRKKAVTIIIEPRPIK